MEFEDYIQFEDGELENDLPIDIADEETPETSDELDSNSDAPETDADEVDLDPEDLKVYYGHLSQLGVLRAPEGFEFDGTYDKLDEVITNTRTSLKEEAREELKAELPDDFKALIDYAKAGGKSLDEYINAYSTNNVENLDLEKLENQRKVLYECYLQTTQYKPEKINRMIDKYEELGTIREEAEDALEVLLADKETKKAELIVNAEKERTIAVAKAAQERESVNAALATMSKNPATIEATKAFMFNPVKTDNGVTTQFNKTIKAISNNPTHLAQLALLVQDYDETEGIKHTALKKEIKTDSLKGIKQLLRDTIESRPSTQGTIRPNNKSSFSFDDFSNT